MLPGTIDQCRCHGANAFLKGKAPAEARRGQGSVREQRHRRADQGKPPYKFDEPAFRPAADIRYTAVLQPSTARRARPILGSDGGHQSRPKLPSAVFRDKDGTAVDPPPAVTVEFCGIRRGLVVGLPSEQEIRSAGGGEILARKRIANVDPPRYDRDVRRPIVILEAKKRLNMVAANSRLYIRDELFRQLAAEAISARHQNLLK